MTSIDTVLREVLVTLKEEQACLELWFKEKPVNEDVLRGIEKSLTKINEALENLVHQEKANHPPRKSYARPAKNS